MSTFLITGSNRGIGLELCKQIHKRGDNVIATCRKASKELRNLGVRIEENIEISSNESITNLRRKLSGVHLDCLIHNAGIYEFNSLENLDKESILQQFEVNALSPILITQSLKHLLNSSSKVAFITSRMGSIEDNTSGSSYGYRMSKVALSMAAKSISIDLLKEDIYVAILHPGLVSTRMTGFTRNGISPEESANGLLKRIDSLNKKNSGTFWHANGEVLPW
ncbi:MULTISPECIES: SDR family oxidoreductase [Prochlorococcus]|uniref:Short-chain dehydrogenase/reductase SDR n=1 Tax=Prochlorococcus marinus str. MIT 9116 TaxID=167544 RepID=A0A0A1ZVS3_PROMR|nr:SDR family oxidoreductase [Prochlorococcus marinus]KGF89772.1 Short-chain dehydrogenase/reductase SDR [Prochlorococcus marinus str. MIT 9107]KGF92379.1 Short-chain dehydrogenase/reductase SDR [Prochlorococcus marinus str. MIT 9116]KGF92697.1 Short-chain dehydrogenase/reductase SDR [Prochlorococcus marinus str. MIT 9123]